MKEGWEKKKLIDACTIQYGYAFDSKQFCDDSTYPQLIRIRDVVRGFSETYYKGDIPDGYYVNKGEYLIGMDGEFNIAPWNSDKALLNQRVCKITSNESIALDGFLYYYMRIILKKIEDETPFVTVKHLSAKRLNDISIAIPPLSIQQQIVSELDLLNGIIEKQKKQLLELDNLAQSIFYQMFGNPVENEMGWEVKKLETFCSSITKGTTPTSIGFKFEDSGVNFVKVESFQNDGTINPTVLAHISNDCNEAMQRSQLHEKDILICIAGATVGKLARVDSVILPANTNQACAIVRLKDESQLLNDFLYGYFRYSYLELVVDGLKKGVAQPNLSLGQIRDFDVILPPKTLQQEFAQKIQSIEHQKQLVKSSIQESESLFNSRMDYYFN